MSNDAIRWDENAGLQAGCDKLPVITRSRRNTTIRRPAMTKSITVAAQQSRKFVEKKYTVGLDLGDPLELVLRVG